jgi:nucleoside-diphosphate-sugar epimerase
MQTILGANGIIASELSKHLPAYTTDVRQVSRNPKKVNPHDGLVSADLLNYAQTEKAVAGSEVVYLVAGLKYDIGVWREQWPKIMQNVLDACKQHRAKLVFFDNVYSYGHVTGPMTEETPFNPTSKKGEVRARIATQLLDEIKQKNLDAMIVRAADFYGPNCNVSITDATVTQRLKAGKRPQWIGNPSKIHSFTFTPDAGKAVALLGNTPSAFNQTWHVPTSPQKITGEEYVRMASEVLNLAYKKPQALSRLGLRVVSLFVPILREFVEMMYQYENDYIFDSTKIEKQLGISATPYSQGIRETLR